jgi:hypothetical protein
LTFTVSEAFLKNGWNIIKKGFYLKAPIDFLPIDQRPLAKARLRCRNRRLGTFFNL